METDHDEIFEFVCHDHLLHPFTIFVISGFNFFLNLPVILKLQRIIKLLNCTTMKNIQRDSVHLEHRLHQEKPLGKKMMEEYG